jgi:hypothetical protein
VDDATLSERIIGDGKSPSAQDIGLLPRERVLHLVLKPAPIGYWFLLKNLRPCRRYTNIITIPSEISPDFSNQVNKSSLREKAIISEIKGKGSYKENYGPIHSFDNSPLPFLPGNGFFPGNLPSC